MVKLCITHNNSTKKTDDHNDDEDSDKFVAL